MPRKKSPEELVEKALLDLAIGDISDAVSLLYLSDEEVLQKLPKLKLINISEIKRPKTGGMEIKFFDRIKACEKIGLTNDSAGEKGMSFFKALEKGAECLKQQGEYDEQL